MAESVSMSFTPSELAGTSYTELDEEALKRARAMPIPVRTGRTILFNNTIINHLTLDAKDL